MWIRRLRGLLRVYGHLRDYELVRHRELPERLLDRYWVYGRRGLYDLLVALRGAGRESTNSPRP